MERIFTMTGYGWTNCPQTTRMQVERFIQSMDLILGEQLVGIYLHGSLAMGCFNPRRSDIDIVIIVREGLGPDDKRIMANYLVRHSVNPHPIELSVMRLADLNPWRYPPTYDFHYSEDYREKFQANLKTSDWKNWTNGSTPGDPDLAAHIPVLCERGIVLKGQDISEIFPNVPDSDYRAALIYDVTTASSRIVENPVYGVLNLCRVQLYMAEAQIASKSEAGEWALTRLPAEYHPLISRALDLYKGRLVEEKFEDTKIRDFAAYMENQIKGAE